MVTVMVEVESLTAGWLNGTTTVFIVVPGKDPNCSSHKP
jgi:hypothetical protein